MQRSTAAPRQQQQHQQRRRRECGGLTLTVERRHDGSSVVLELRRSNKVGSGKAAGRSTLSLLLGIGLPAIIAVLAMRGVDAGEVRVKLAALLGTSASASMFALTFAVLVLVVLVWPRPVIAESILAIRDVGIQHTVHRATLPFSLPFPFPFPSTPSLSLPLPQNRQARLIPRDEIMDVVVHEAFRRWSIVAYVAVLCVSAGTMGGGRREVGGTAGDLVGGVEGREGRGGRGEDDGDDEDNVKNENAESEGKLTNTRTLDTFALQPGGDGGVTVLFPHLRPRLPLVQLAYTEVHRVLF